MLNNGVGMSKTGVGVTFCYRYLTLHNFQKFIYTSQDHVKNY
jgi:hypothetical protein